MSNTMYYGEIIISQPSIIFLNVMKLYPDGSVEFLNGASPNDAAIAFLKAVNLIAPNFLRTDND